MTYQTSSSPPTRALLRVVKCCSLSVRAATQVVALTLTSSYPPENPCPYPVIKPLRMCWFSGGGQSAASVAICRSGSSYTATQRYICVHHHSPPIGCCIIACISAQTINLIALLDLCRQVNGAIEERAIDSKNLIFLYLTPPTLSSTCAYWPMPRTVLLQPWCLS